MDAEYLKANVGDILAAGLTAVVLNQPEDTVCLASLSSLLLPLALVCVYVCLFAVCWG
jgi:hypothetical protein